MKFAFEKPFDFPIVAISGYAGAGKSTAADCFDNYQRISFAAPIKRILSMVYHLPIEHFYDNALKMLPNENLNGLTPRRALQLIGTEGFRNLIDVATWSKHFEREANMIMSRNQNLSGIVVDDLRFLDELEMLQHHGATIVYIENPNVSKAFDHQSENELEQIKLRSNIVLNNSTINDLHQKLLAFK